MGNIDVVAKWSLESNNWISPKSSKDFGRSFAIASYDDIISNNGKTDYIIIAQGSRVEDHSKDFINIKENEVRVDNVISYYGKRNGNYVIKLFLMDADAPIIEEAKLFAKFIENLALKLETNSVNIIGLSKCSVMNFYVPRFFSNVKTFSKVNIYNIATPYLGTKIASPTIFYREIRNFIESKFGEGKIADFLYDKVIHSGYEKVSSNSHMDYDIAIKNGIPFQKLDLYDETVIKNIFCDDNVETIKELNSFKNFVTSIDDEVRKEALKTLNLSGIGLCLLDKYFFDGKSDGMVLTSTQRVVEDVLDIKSYYVKSHHDVNSNIRAFNEVLGIVDDTIDEYNDKIKVMTKSSV